MSGTSSSLAAKRMLREVLETGIDRTYIRVTSSSMSPRLVEGDRILVERVSPRVLKPGDIIVFDSESADLVVHRLIWRNNLLGRPSRIYTKGDALDYLDRATSADRVLGRVVGLEQGEERSRLTTPADRLRCIALAARHGFLKLLRKLGLRHRDS